jgi:asparagine synthase (glutamine-hydrolysing)
MCGIAGILHLDGRPASPVLLKRMLDAIVHRGPDGEGSFIDGSYAVGHRRLAIIDLSAAGHQPRESADGRYVLSYNGEVYNFNELRLELEAKGYQFHSRTDTEVVLNAFCEWGTKSFIKFNGMFALAIWDKKEKSLLLARDRYGIKPLYYSSEGNVFTFGSEVKALLASGFVNARMNSEGLLEYLTFQNFFSDQTLFNGVKMLPAGTFSRIQSRDGRLSMVSEQYWDYLFVEPEGTVDEGELLEELDRLFIQAVSRQLVSDVDVGAYLSGGMDSGSVTAIAAKQLPYIKTFTCGFDLNSASGVELGYDERSTAEYMSYMFKTEHYEMILKAGDMERVMPRLTWHLEEPRVGQSYPNFYAAQLASKFVKVVLSGTGGDELFGGYPWRYYRAVVNNDFEHYIDKYYSFWQRLVPAEAMKKMLAPIWGDVAHIDTRDIFKNVFSRHQSNLSRPEDYINHSLYFEAKTFLHGLLVVEDKLSMAHSLETRVPFLDNDLVNFAMKLPARLKLGNLGEVVRLNENEPGSKVAKYFEKTKDGKLLLRKMMERHIPPVITSGVKQGFSGPDSSWFRGESIGYVKRKLYDPKAKINAYLDPDLMRNMVDEHLEGRENRRLLIWSLLSLEKWCEGFLINK